MDLEQFELFEKISLGRQARDMRISLNERGAFSLNQKAFDNLKQPKAVELLFNKGSGVIAMRPCDPELKHAYSVNKQGSNKSFLVRAMSFCNYYGLVIKRTVVFQEPEVEKGILLLNTRTVIQLPPRTAKAKGQARAAKATEQQFVLGAPETTS